MAEPQQTANPEGLPAEELSYDEKLNALMRCVY